MRTRRTQFRVILPLFSVSVWVLLVLLPLCLESLRVVAGNRFISICLKLCSLFPGIGFVSSAISASQEQRSWVVMALNLPAFPAELLESIGTWPMSWSPPGLSLFLWRMLTFPILALPAWFYVGRGIDNIRSRTVFTLWDMIAGSILSLGCAILCAGLAFGLPRSDRDTLLIFMTGGLALWALLFDAVAIAAVQRGRPKLRIVVQVISGVVFGILMLWAWTNSRVPLLEVSSTDGDYIVGWRSGIQSIGVFIASQYLSWLMLRLLKSRAHSVIASENAV